jgi:predicted nucleic acid-binding protein
VIHLDTSFLIRAGVTGSPEDRRLRRWLRARETVRVSAIVWAEFLCGPVPARVAEDAAELFGEPVLFDGIDATLAAQLFNAGGRRSGTMIDSIVAAIAIRAGATLATGNVADFRRYAPLGLTLASVQSS